MSYRITIDGQPFCSSNFDHSQLLDPKVSLEVNKSGSLTFTMMPDHPYYDSIEFRQNIFDVYLNDELIFEGIPVSEDVDFWNRKTITCEGELTFLNDTIQRQAVYRNQSVQTLLAEYLAIHNAQADESKQFTIGAVTVNGGNTIFRYTNYQTTMQELQEDLVENFGGYFRVRHDGGVMYLDYLDSSPHTSSQTIRIGKNLVDFSRNLSSLDICTVLIPLGCKTGNQLIDGLDERLMIKSVNNNKDYLVGTAQAYYGNIWKTQVWDDVTTAAALKSKGEAFLDDVQWANLVISATAFDLGLAEETVEQFHILDMIRVVSEPHGIDRYFLLSALEIDLDHPANTQITLGQDGRLSLTAKSAQMTADIERQVTSIQVNASENARNILDAATDGAIQILYNQDGVAYELRINNSQNPDTATKWWRYNSGGWGYTSDGGQTYTIAATMDGAFVANLITTGILKSDDGTTFYLDLDNGVLKGNFSELKISGNAGATQAYADQAGSDAISTAASNTSSAISTYDTNLNQQAVFNKLTNNQANQGIYLQNGNLYINASMIAAGILTGREINNGNGTFQVTEQGVLTASSGQVGGWKISSNGKALYNDAVDPNDSNTVYRVYLQPPLASNPDSTWVVSCQKSTDGGQSFSGTFVLYSNGSAKFGDLSIASNGSISTPNVGGAWITLGTKANNFVHNISAVNDHYYDYRSNFMLHSRINAESITFGDTDNDGNTNIKTSLDKYQLQLSAQGSSFIGNLTIKPPTDATRHITIQPTVVATW